MKINPKIYKFKAELWKWHTFLQSSGGNHSDAGWYFVNLPKKMVRQKEGILEGDEVKVKFVII